MGWPCVTTRPVRLFCTCSGMTSACARLNPCEARSPSSPRSASNRNSAVARADMICAAISTTTFSISSK